MSGIVFIVVGLPKLQNISISQGYFGSLGLPPELVIPVALLEVIGGIFLLIGILTRITSAIFIIEMVGATLAVWLSQEFVGGPLLKQSSILTSSFLTAISSTLLLIGPGRKSVEWDLFKREIYPGGDYVIQRAY